MGFEKICNDIKSLKIQGAENVAIAAVKAYYLNPTKQAVKKLISLRPTEPCLRNALKFVELDQRNISHALKHFEEAKEKISEFASRKIENNMVVFTHCHSSTVTKALIEAKKQGKKFEVYNTETRPLFQGRITAAELAKAGIKVTHFVDSAARLALKKSDLFLMGADAITTEGKVINKIGSELFAEIANKLEVPLYICTDSWKFDPKTIFGYEEPIEKRAEKEVWPNAPKNVKINNLAFEKIDPRLISGIISELGIYNPEMFVQEVKKVYAWMLQ